MVLKVSKKGLENAQAKKEEHKKLGRRSHAKGASYERDVAKLFKSAYGVDLVRTPQSGGFVKNALKADDFRGDIVSADKDVVLDLHIECKNAKSWSLPAWLSQAEEDCPKTKTPIVVFHKHKSSKDYVAISLEDFFKLVPKENILAVKEV